MATGQMNRVFQHLHQSLLNRDGDFQTDGQLLDGFIRRREEAAIQTLILRHGPMVLAVCRRILRNHHDAEDAFQATFLVLVRKATTIIPKEMVANWLYGVACNTALKARALAAQKHSRERQVKQMPEPEAAETRAKLDLQALLDEELRLLPDKYRSPIVLCDLEGKTRKEAADQLGWPEGTVAGRLARARAMLAKRLARHGLVLTGATLPGVLAENLALASLPAALTISTTKAACLFATGQAIASGVISLKVAALTEGVLKAMLITKLKIATAIGLVLGLVAYQGGALSFDSAAAEQNKSVPDAARPVPVSADAVPKPPQLVDEKLQKAEKDFCSFSSTNCGGFG
jgi:RNA polymerase sigma-70 factor (ECF subfamily)